ncbi:MAG: hypothetical protein IKR40_00105 [Treponema sp.]|nr:hypothetical protein [Treponema sp.]
MGKEKSINVAVDDAIKENLLDGFFKRQKAEVIGMILEEFNEEIYKKNIREEGYDEGYSNGINAGQRQKSFEVAENMLRKGIPKETISECTGLSVEQVKEIARSVSAGTPTSHFSA